MTFHHRVSSFVGTLSLVSILCSLTIVASPDLAAAQNLRSVPVAAVDIVYSPLTGHIYAAVPTLNAIVTIDPVAGATVGAPLAIGSQPRKLAISDDGAYLYVGLGGASIIKRVHLVPTPVIDAEIPLGSDPNNGARFAEDIEVMPGNPDVIAVTLMFTSISPGHDAVVIFDHGVARPTNINNPFELINRLQFGSQTRLYGLNRESSGFQFYRLNVDVNGVSIADETGGLFERFDADFQLDGGIMFTTDGRMLDPEARTVTGSFTEVRDSSVYHRAVEPHASAGVVYYVTENFFTHVWTLRTFSIATQLQTGAIVLPGVLADFNKPVGLIKWGTEGLAMHTSHDGKVWLMETGIVAPDPPAISITTPTTNPTYEMLPGTLILAGTAVDPGGSPAQISWSNDRGGSGTIAGAGVWQIPNVPIVEGVNVITVTVTGSSGRTATDTITVTAPTAISYFLAEGATGSFFDMDLAIANPNNVAVPVAITYLLEGGATISSAFTLGATSRTTIRVDEVPNLGNAALSTIVRSTAGLPLVVERTMRWDGVGQYGSHTDKATAGLAPTWYFAEGSQGFFATYLLLANPNNSNNTATVDWLREGETPVRRVYSLAPNSRTTIYAGDDADLRDRSFGIVVSFSTPAVADRTMYFGLPPDVLFKGGHNSAGATAPATDWLLAEGATGSFFETFVLIANPNDSEVTATLTFLRDNGAPVTRTVPVPAKGRRTVNIEAESTELANAAVATRVTAPLPLVVERAQYWPFSPAEWYEAHNSFGVTAPGLRWGLAEGRVGDPVGVPAAAYQTYVLLANPGNSAAQVTLSFLREDGSTIVKNVTVNAQSRRNIQIAGPASDVPELANEMFGVVIQSDQPIAVERAMYGNAGIQIFGAGTNATATPLP